MFKIFLFIILPKALNALRILFTKFLYSVTKELKCDK